MVHLSWFRLPARLGRAASALGVGLVLGSCAPATNLLSLTGPRFEGHYARPVPPAPAPAAGIRVVTFNIRFAREIARAIEVLRHDSLRGADILALQEMDEAGADRIARTLGYDYAFYPAVIHPTSGRYFGPAVLSRWPIERSWKVRLPHESRTRHQRRTATAAEVIVRGTKIRVYGVHLETPGGAPDAVREDQMRTVLADASPFDGPVVIAGDFNSYGIGVFLERRGYRWLTRRIDPTISIFTWDHVFVRGLRPAGPASAGVVRQVHGASDHRPVWAVVVPDAAATRPGVAEASPAR
jgi:endonuclease/exonuclease/phosphatase family metal-dependent hydrolase